MAESLVLRDRPWYSPPKVKQILTEVKRYPVLPILVILLLLVVPAIGANWIAPHDPFDGDLNARLLPPVWIGEKSNTRTVVDRITDRPNQFTVGEAARQIQGGKATLITAAGEDPARDVAAGDQLFEVKQSGGSNKYLLGTDKVGRDILSRIIYGSRISVIVAGIAIFISGAIGATLGITAGYFGGWVDSLLMRLVDISLSIPIILMALVLVTALGASYQTIVIVLVIFLWAQYARQARGETLTVRVQDFIARAKVAGASDVRIMLRHVFPNVFNSMVVLATTPGRLRHHPGSEPELPWRRNSQAQPGVGPDGFRWQRVDYFLLVGVPVPGSRHPVGGNGYEFAWRLAPRQAGPQAEANLVIAAIRPDSGFHSHPNLPPSRGKGLRH